MALGILARVVLVRAERLAWAFIGTGVLRWSSGEIYSWWVFSQIEEPPFPSIADGLYLAFYPLAYVGIVLLVSARVRRFQPIARRGRHPITPTSPPRSARMSRSPRG